MLFIQIEEIGPIYHAVMRHRAGTGTFWEHLPRGTTAVKRIHRPNLAMPEAVGGIGELNRNEWPIIKAIESQSVVQKLLYQSFANTQWQKFMHNNPLIMPAHQALRFAKNIGGSHTLPSQVIYNAIVEFEKSQVQLRDNEMHIVSRVTNQRPPLLIARQIVGLPNIVDADQKCIGIIHIVQKRFSTGACAIERFQVKARRAKIAQFVVTRMVGKQTAVGSNIVCDKLTENRETGGYTRVVRVIKMSTLYS